MFIQLLTSPGGDHQLKLLILFKQLIQSFQQAGFVPMVPPTAMCNRTLNAPDFAPRALKQHRNLGTTLEFVCYAFRKLFTNYSSHADV